MMKITTGGNKKKRNIGQIILHIAFILITILYICPLLLVISASLSTEASLRDVGFSILPKEFTLEAYKIVFRNPEQILDSYATTIIFSLLTTVLAIIIMGVTAYPLSRSNFKLKNVVTFYFFFTMLFNGGMVPSYIINSRYLHLNNTLWIYILPSIMSAYSLIVIKTNYKNIPTELIEAAKIDGAGEWFICFRIIMPLSKATLASIGFLALVGKWNDWLTASIYITEPRLYSLQYLLQRILREAEFIKQMAALNQLVGVEVLPSETVRYAMAVIAAGPMLVAFPFFQKYFIKGMTIGAVKG